MKSPSKRKSITGTVYVLNLLISVIISGCTDDGNATHGPMQNIAFEIVVLDEHQQEGTVFAPGTDAASQGKAQAGTVPLCPNDEPRKALKSSNPEPISKRDTRHPFFNPD